MENKNITEGLSENLPDYIQKKLGDKDLIEKIETRLSSDLSFRKEFEELRDTMNFLGSSELKSPPDNYFSNLSVNINRRIENKNKKFRFFANPGFILKKLIPVLGLIILAAYFIFNSVNNDITNTTIADNKNIKKDTSGKTHETTENNEKSPDLISKNSVTEITAVYENETAPIHGKHKKKAVFENKTNPVLNFQNDVTEDKTEVTDIKESEQLKTNGLIADNLLFNDDLVNDDADIENEDADLIYQTDTDNNEDLEEELLHLSQEEQKELLENLKKSQTL